MRIVTVLWAVLSLCILGMTTPVLAAPYAALVIDARSGEVLHARNADTKLHPASLTKMMTLYVVFDAIKRGELSLDQKIVISKMAASEQPSRLGMKPGQRIAVRYLIRAAAVKSANDAATALGEAVSGSEKAFAKRMTNTAHRLGMTRSNFRNAHGLTQSGHLSTARDMTLLGRRLFFDFPEYYNLFSRKSTYAGVRDVANTNRKLLSAYSGADGIKTGYTAAAGFNLVASARRGNKRVIATVFGGKTSATRNAKVAELLDLGFDRSKTRVAVRKPAPIDLGVQAKTIRVASSGAVKKSLRPKLRTIRSNETLMAEAEIKAIEQAVLKANKEPVQPTASQTVNTNGQLKLAGTQSISAVSSGAIKPAKSIIQKPPQKELRVVTRVSTAGSRYWGVQVGAFSSRHLAERALLQTALRELQALEGSERRIDYATVNGYKKYRALFVGLNQAEARMACARLRARNAKCSPLRPGT